MKLTPERLWQAERIGAAALAPDGRRAVCAVTRYDTARNVGSTRLWLLDTTRCAPRLLTTVGEKDGQPAWSPRGDRIAFVARRTQQGRTDGTPQLYVIAPDGGEARRVSDFAPGIESFRWLPDGRRIVFAAWVWPGLRSAKAQARRHRENEDRKETGLATREAYHRHWDHAVPPGRALQLWLLDVQTGRAENLFEGSGLELQRDGSADFAVHPGGRRIAFVHDPAREPVLGNRMRVSELDLKTRRVRTLADDAAWDFSAPAYSPDGSRLALLAANVGQSHIAHQQPAVLEGGAWRLLAAAWDASADAPLRWQADGRAIFFTAEEQGRCPLWRCTVGGGGGGGLERVHTGGWVQGFDIAADVLLVAADSARHPVRLLARQAGGEPLRIEGFNDALFSRLALGETHAVKITGALGDAVQMWLTFPPGFDARRRWPVLHVIHGGPYNAAGDTFGYRWNTQVFAQAGYVVAQVNFHGSTGFGFDFKRSLVGRQGELELLDIEAGTDWLLQQRWADAGRVFATGGSYGGFLVAWMNGHVPPGRYRAYVCHAGVFDRIATFAADSYPVRPKDLAAKYWEDLPRVLAQSPHAFAAQMHTPTLVIHGAKDYRVPDCNGLAYYNTLKARGVPARLLWFPDENHWILKPRNSLLWYREFLSWLQANEKPSSVARSSTTPSIGTSPV